MIKTCATFLIEGQSQVKKFLDVFIYYTSRYDLLCVRNTID